eukprot:jgi/Botrbrau1/9789/Bobra.85_1s0033.1
MRALVRKEWRKLLESPAPAFTQFTRSYGLPSPFIPGRGDDDAEGRPTTPWVRSVISGVDLMRNPKYNKGLAFSEVERDRLYLRGLLPPAILSQDVQAERVMINIRNMTNDLDRHNYLSSLQERNERLFYYVLRSNMEELLPIVHMPTVSTYCQTYGLMFKSLPRSLYISMADKGRVFQTLKNWPERRVKVICLTDGERVGSLGDLGVQSVGVPISKLALYTACGGILPSTCLPVCIDAGTDNEELLKSPFYVGSRHRRVRGEEFMDLIDEFLWAVRQRFGNSVVIHFEDMTYQNLARLTNAYRGTFPCFSDDMQGLGAAVLAGVLAGSPLTGRKLLDHTFMLVGEGAGASAVAELIADAIAHATMREGGTIIDARKRLWLVDDKGLITRSRLDTDQLGDHKIPFMHEGPLCNDLLSSIRTIKPSVLIGLSLHTPQPFTKEICQAMAESHERPIIMPLSCPGAEVGPLNAYEWTQGRCLYASRERRTDAPPVRLSDGRLMKPSSVHTAYIFPGVGLGTIVSRSTRLRDEMFLVAAETLASLVTDGDRQMGSLYPSMANIRSISSKIACAVARKAYAAQVATNLPQPHNLLELMDTEGYQPGYPQYR